MKFAFIPVSDPTDMYNFIREYDPNHRVVKIKEPGNGYEIYAIEVDLDDKDTLVFKLRFDKTQCHIFDKDYVVVTDCNVL